MVPWLIAFVWTYINPTFKAIGGGGENEKQLFFLFSSSFKIWIMEVAKLLTELKNLDPLSRYGLTSKYDL